MNMLQMGIVERPGQVSEPTPVQQAASRKIATGQPMTPAEEDSLIFGELDKIV